MACVPQLYCNSSHQGHQDYVCIDKPMASYLPFSYTEALDAVDCVLLRAQSCLGLLIIILKETFPFVSFAGSSLQACKYWIFPELFLFFLLSWTDFTRSQWLAAYILPTQNSSLSLPHMFIGLLDISSWMSDRHLKFNMAKSQVISPPSLAHTSQVFSVVVNSRIVYSGPTSRSHLSFPSFSHTHIKFVRISHHYHLLNISWIVSLFINSKLQAVVQATSWSCFCFCPPTGAFHSIKSDHMYIIPSYFLVEPFSVFPLYQE